MFLVGWEAWRECSFKACLYVRPLKLLIWETYGIKPKNRCLAKQKTHDPTSFAPDTHPKGLHDLLVSLPPAMVTVVLSVL